MARRTRTRTGTRTSAGPRRDVDARGEGAGGAATRLRLVDGGLGRRDEARDPAPLPGEAPCPCGSGRSWDRCCRPRVKRDIPVIRDWARSWLRLGDRVLRFAFDLLEDPPEAHAIRDLAGGDPGARVNVLFENLTWKQVSAWITSWSLFWWIPGPTDPLRADCGWGEPTLADEWFARGRRLSRRERAYLDAALGSAYSFLEVERRAPGAVFFRDLLLEKRYLVVDPALARDVQEGWIVHGAVARMPFGDALLGAGAFLLRTGDAGAVKAFRRRLLRRNRSLDPAFLRGEWRRLAELYVGCLAGGWETRARVVRGGRSDAGR